MDCCIKENADIGLHDCRTNRISKEDHSITFYFPAGFYYLKDMQVSDIHRGEMYCHLSQPYPESVSVYIYRKNRWGKIIREDWSTRFVEAINAGKFEFEFVGTYRAYQTILFKGYIWFEKAPYHRACEIELHTDEITYRWYEV